jgi:hypothetical protein
MNPTPETVPAPADATDNGDGTITLAPGSFIDNGDGTVTPKEA